MKFKIFVLMTVAVLAVLCEARVNDLIWKDNFGTLADDVALQSANESEVVRLQQTLERQQNLSLYQRRIRTYDHLPAVADQDQVLDAVTAQELELVHGPASNRYECLAHQFADTLYSQAGMISLMANLCEPASSSGDLQARANVVELLAHTPDLRLQVAEILQRLHNAESLLLSFVGEDAIVESNRDNFQALPFGLSRASVTRENKYLAGVQYYANQIGKVSGLSLTGPAKGFVGWLGFSYLTFVGSRFGAKKIVSLVDPAALRAANYRQGQIDQFMHQRETVLREIQKVTFPWKANAKVGAKVGALFSAYAIPFGVGYLVKQITDGKINLPDTGKFSKRNVLSAAGLLGTLWAAHYGAKVYSSYKVQSTKVTLLQTKLIAVADYLKALDELYALCNQYPTLKQGLRSYAALEAVLTATTNGDYQILLNQLRSNTFKGQPTYFLNGGVLCSTLALLEKHQARLYRGLASLGELDLMHAAAHLVVSATNERPWCIAQFAVADRPFVTLEGVWHPAIKSHPVLNDVKLGGAHAPTSMIISGPNAGGKSTVLKSTVTAVLLAQAIGVAPAQAAVLTPFNKIVTYINITDDLAQGASYFKAGVLRAKKVTEQIDATIKQNGFALVGLDEVFNGTSSQEGEAAATTLVEKVGTKPNTVQISVTHFKQVTELADEQPEQFANYKVIVHKNEDGSLRYPFKLESGKSDQIIAFDVLANEGFDQDFVNKARERAERK